MTFELTVLGASGTFPAPDSASTGYLLRADGTSIWVDAGTGTFANLQRHLDYFTVDAVFLSHLHLDHILDIYPFYYGLRYSVRSSGPSGVPVYAPAGAEEYLVRILSSDGKDGFDGYLDFKPISVGEKVDVGPFNFDFVRTVHPIETYGMRIEAGGRVLIVTSDSGPASFLPDFAKGADVLVSEATTHDEVAGLEEVHMTAQDAGRLASDAGVGRLVLTHISPGLEAAKSVREAARHFNGPIDIARDGLKIEV